MQSVLYSLVPLVLTLLLLPDPSDTLGSQTRYLHGLTVSAPAGTFRGVVRIAPSLSPYKAFLGIPYALPPVGELRFAKPQPYPVIQNVYNAKAFGPTCIQGFSRGQEDLGQEDCLYLNVFAPMTSPQETGAGHLYKVMVYLYGGSLYVGSSTEHIPGDLVTEGNIIVVTFNYRLAWLGFTRGDHPSLPGNQGFWDQVMALNWVKNNIHAFGGDPDDVTLSGQSAGGLCASTLSISPHGQGLFTKVIAMSGAALSFQSTPESSANQLNLLTGLVGCTYDNINDTVACLKALPQEKFHQCIEILITAIFPAVDGDFLPAAVPALLADSEYLDQVGFYDRDYMFSLTSNEGLFTLMGAFAVSQLVGQFNAQTWSQVLSIPQPAIDYAYQWYSQPGNSLTTPALDILADLVIVLPTFGVLQAFVANGERTGSAYTFVYNFKPSYVPSSILGFPHGLDIAYVFDREVTEILYSYYYITTQQNFGPVDWTLKDRIIDIIANFAKSGNPGASLETQLNISWPPYDLVEEHYLVFSPEPAVSQFPFRNRRNFWNSLLQG